MLTKCTNGECGEQFEIENSRFGQKINCIECGKEFRATFYIPTEEAGTKQIIPSASIRTICPNLECGQKYKVKSEAVGSTARCKKCNTVFKVEPYKEVRELTLQIENTETEETSPTGERKRRSSKEIIAEKIDKIREEVELIMPLLTDALEKKENETGTCMLIDSMLQNVLGYEKADIKREQNIKGKRADYVLNIKDEDSIIIEAKRIGMNLRESQIFQASAYGAHSGIKWIVLTNALVWQLYKISTGEKIENHLIFTIDLLDGLDNEEAEYFYLISKDGMSRKNLLDNMWEKIRSLSDENIIEAILSDGVISKIRTTISQQTGYKKIDNEELRQIIEEKIFKL